MAWFADRHGRHWPITLDTCAIRRVAAATGVHIARFLDDGMSGYRDMAGDPVKFGEVACVLAGADVKSLGPALDGPALDAAATAFLASFREFLPEPDGKERNREDTGPCDLLELCDRLAGIVGVNPRGMTLRELTRMAAARQEADWLLAAIPAAWIINRRNTKKAVSATEIIPAPFRPTRRPVAPTEEEKAQGWAEFDRKFNVGDWKKE